MDAKTRIVEVVHANGDRATAAPRRPNATLFEVVDGPRAGTRGADADLFDQVGALDWDRTTVSVYETGQRVAMDAFNAPTASRAAVQAACDAAVDAIQTLDETEWAGWVVYVLDHLDGSDRMGLTLGNVAHDLDERLRAGRW